MAGLVRRYLDLIYDSYPHGAYLIEGFGYCAVGERRFVAEGRLAIGGRYPSNTGPFVRIPCKDGPQS
jgi:hypothetical protein